MPFPRTLSGYLLREVLLFATLGILAVGGVLVVQNALRHVQNLAGMGLTAGDAVSLIGVLVAQFSTYALPIAFLFGVMVAVGRLSGDHEIAAMQSLGVSFGQILSPILAIAVLVGAGTGWLLHTAEPSARRDLRGLLSQVAARGGIIQPGTFNRLDRTGQRLIYVDERRDRELEGVLIFDRTNADQAYTVVAASGRFSFEPDSLTGRLELTDGDIHFERAVGDEKYQRISFDAFEYAFAMDKLVGVTFERLQPQEMDTSQLEDVLASFEATGFAPPGARVQERERYEVQLQRRRALPFAPVLFTLVGVPLGIRRARGAKSYGVMVCVGLVFGYYALLSAFSQLADDGNAPAWLAVWIPNVAMAGIGLWLVRRAPRAEA